MDSSFSLHSICAAAEIKILGTLLYLLFMVVYKKVRSSPQKKTMASSPPPSDSSWGHHVFSSFSSVDVPITFLNRLWKELRRKGFDPFTDDEIERCVLIGPQLIKAISVSRIVIVILSRNYASSSRCLDELVEIIKCKEELGQRVVTVFYELDAIDVEKQTGGFGKIFKKTCKRSRTKEDIARWSRALAEVATIAGYYSSQWHYEAAMIENIATDISKFLNDSTQSSDFQGFVGMEAHMEKIEQMLCLDSDEVKTIGIWGPCGIGKTTIARFLYSKHSHKFDLSTIANVKAWARPAHNEYDAELQLQNQFLSQLLNHKYTDEIRHLEVAQKSLKDKKVLVVFDDVDSSGQLDALAKETLCLGPGSRIIITTEEPRILNTPWIQDIYKVDFPPPDEALQIFCLHVFGQKSPYDGFEKLARETTTLSGNYPLGLRFMGSYLRGVSLEYWKDELPRLRTYLDGEIGSIIKLTYDSLCGEDKELSHHHISCLRNGELTERMDEYLAKGVRQQGIIKNQDLKEDIYTSERVFEGMSNGLLHTVYIYCADTLQYSFASHLSMDFRRKGIYAFVNCNETLDVIKRVSASVVIFSKSCFYSTSDLDKLMRGFQCRRKTNQLVVPVFYGINPSDVVVPEHESADQIREWSSRLQELRELLGHQSREDCSERELVEEIVKDVYEKLFPTEQIGINSRLLEIEQLLRIQTWGIRHIGIWGMPGIGKTTLAKAFFDQISGGYEASCFIKHFDKAFHEKGLHCLLEEHFGKILRELPRACSSITRPSLPRDKLKKKRTLVVLDDVHNPLVAESFLGGFHWFAPGSLIIITSRDKQVFRLCQINHVYEVQSLNENEALQLFSHCAFLKDMSEQNLLKLSMEVIDYANGNPFALSFYGRELKGKKQSEMETTFLKFKLRTPYKIHDLFKSSYETLNDNEKNIFLDTACFFNGENVDYVMRLLEACGFFPHVGIDVLVEKCLVTISENRVKMHRIIQDFGREIINGETVQIERRSRLWEPWAIKFLLEDGEFKEIGDPKATYTHALATEDIEGISLDTSNLLFDVKPTAFENMLNLRFLKIYCSNYDDISGLRLPRGLESLPYELRLLHWENYPLQSLPQDFDSCHLVEPNMSNSQLQKLWEGTKNTDRLKMVSLCHSQHLTQIDDICKAKNIELIDLQGCTRLQTFPATGQLQHLRVVNLSGCREIKSFPEVSPNIVELHLQGTGIRELPISIVTLSGQDKLHRELSSLLTEFSGVSNDLNLEKLTSGVQVVTSTQHLSKLVSLNMKDCVNLQSLPPMVDLESLKVLNMSGCSKLDDIQSFPRNLKELYLAGTAIKNLPQLPWSIEILNAHGCVSLRSIPFAFKQLPRYYTFSNCFALSALLIKCFVESTLTNVERIAREYQQEQKLNKSLASSFTVPSPASKKITFDMQSGSSVMVQLGSSWRNILGFAILVEVAFSEDYNEAGGFGISCICRWKDEECVSHRLEKNFNYWTTGEGVLKDHMFVFCDINMYQGTCEGNDSTILAELVVFEFFTVNKQGSLDESCTVTKCGVYVITAADRDTGPNVTQSFSSSDYLQELSDKETQDVLRVIHDGLDEKQRGLFLYMACLFNDEESDLLAPLIASNGLGISSGLKVLANKSLIHISPYGVIVRQVLLQKIGREIVCRQSTLPHRSPMLEIGFKKVSIDSSSPLSRKWKYDVFTSFSGEDDCNNKISNLLAEFEGKLISTLKNKMKRSKSVSPELVQAIRESRGSIVVLSKNYASSTRCLDELVEIMNCKKELAQKVVAIFYDVDPSDVRLQIGDFGRAFKTTCIGKSKDEKQKWVRALADLANITGLITRKWDDEENMIEKSGCHVSKKIDHTTSIDYAEVVRVEDHLTGISSLSSSESEDVKETFGISVSLEKGEEVTPGRVAMPVEPPYWFRQEGKLIRSEAWSPSFIDRLPFAELYSGEIPAAFLQGLGNIRSMLQSEKSK